MKFDVVVNQLPTHPSKKAAEMLKFLVVHLRMHWEMTLTLVIVIRRHQTPRHSCPAVRVSLRDTQELRLASLSSLGRFEQQRSQDRIGGAEVDSSSCHAVTHFLFITFFYLTVAQIIQP